MVFAIGTDTTLYDIVYGCSLVFMYHFLGLEINFWWILSLEARTTTDLNLLVAKNVNSFFFFCESDNKINQYKIFLKVAPFS